MEITRDMYRDALHIYLKYAFPDDDEQYYSKWAWLDTPKGVDGFFKERDQSNMYPPSAKGMPREVRFGCKWSGNTKLRCYEDGFYFDTNHSGDPPEIVAAVKELKVKVETEWERVELPVHGVRHMTWLKD